MAQRRKNLLIVDGYNVLRSGARYRHLRYDGPNPDYASDAFNRAREALINDVVAYAGKDWEAVIVFDAGQNQFSTGATEVVGGVRVMFSPAGSSADKVIESLAQRARERQREALVVSSDAAIQSTVFGGGVTRMSANGFSFAVESSEHEYELDTSPKVSIKNTLAERLDPETRSRLMALRDGR